MATGLDSILADLLLAVADDKLLLGHRNSDWTGLGPILEEDIAFSSIAQDEIAHAQALYQHAATLLGGRADDLAFGRGPEAFRSAAIVEIPDEYDWATAIARQLLCDHFDRLRLARLGRSSDATLAALARRLGAEEAVHVDHADGWIMRLGRGTDESQARLQRALDALAPHAASLFEPVAHEEKLVAAGLYPALEGGEADPGGHLFRQWSAALDAVTSDADLNLHLAPLPDGFAGGRRGRHTEHLAPLLDEMCEVYRLEPGAAW